MKRTPLKRTGFKRKAGKPLKKVRDWSTFKADTEFSRYIRERDKTCFFCPNKATQNSHFWGRANSATRYDPANCDGICGGCHMRHEGNKHGLYRDLKIKQLGMNGYLELATRATSIVKRSEAIKACQQLLADYQAQLDQLV